MLYKSIFISDIHLGTRMSQSNKVLDFLRDNESEKLYLVGDIIDGWALQKNFYWPQEHNDVIQKLLRKARKGTDIIYLPGNHDEFMRSFGSLAFGNIQLVDDIVHTGIDGKKYLVIHGDQFDLVIRNMKWLAHFGTWAYDTLILVNFSVAKFRSFFGLPYWSLSAWAKYKVKKAVNFITDFEDNLAEYAKRRDCDGVICGHIHHPNIRDIGELKYMNCGDFVESCSVLVEHMDGTWEIIR